MKTYRKELWFHAPNQQALINITPEVKKYIDESWVSQGLLLVHTKHI